MPSSDYVFPDDDDPVTNIFSTEFNPGFHFDNANNANSPTKDIDLMDFQGGDVDSPAMYAAPSYGFVQQAGQFAAATIKPNCQQPSHRGSTSSSSSLRSTDSGSPQTSVHATPNRTSPGEWAEERGVNEDAFSMKGTVDMSQCLTLPGDTSSPTPPAPNNLWTDIYNRLPYSAPPPKKRRAQTNQRMGHLSNRSTSRITHHASNEMPPNATYIPRESSPNAMPTTFSSPDGNFGFEQVFANTGMPSNWPIMNGQINDHPLLPMPNAESSHMSNHNMSNGNTPASIPDRLEPRLVIHPMPAKSRVETQIPLKITVHNLPKGIKKVHLPTHTIAKPKLLQKHPAGPSPDMLEMTTMLVCTSVMGDKVKQSRAMAQAARKTNLNDPNSSTDSSEGEEIKSQDGGEVRICTGCITRERKRAGRKKNKKPEEEELWDRFERDRAIVFNTHEVKDWETVTAVMADPTGAGLIKGDIPEGTVQVETPMRIACYCRHHGEKTGFQVIITLKDHLGKLVAQAISSSIMITDDHKTPTNPCPSTTSQQSPQPMAANGSMQPSIPQSSTAHSGAIQPNDTQTLTPYQPYGGDTCSLPFHQNHSTPDFQSPEQCCSMDLSFGSHGNISQLTPTAVTPHNVSRQTSPASPLSPLSTGGNRKRKASMVGKVPVGLAMTKIDTNQLSPSMAHGIHNDSAAISTGPSPFSASIVSTPLNGDLTNQGQQHMLDHVSQSLGTGPAAPNHNGTEPFAFSRMTNRVVNMDRPVNQLFSAPVSAYPSRAPSPSQLRPEAVQHAQLPQGVFPASVAPSPSILRIIPNEGSKCGGAEITVLGSNFTNDGLEVYFGQNRAITTTWWGPTSLVCMLPPSSKSGPVPVSIKQPNRRPIPQSALFTYKGDDEDLLIRTAFQVLMGQGSVTDPVSLARQILFQHAPASGSNNLSFAHLGMDSGEAVETSLLRVLEALDLDENADTARINLRGNSGQTMLHLACSLGYLRFVAGLLSRGAKVDVGDNGGFTPLHMAAMNDQPEIVRRLIAKGADRNARSLSNVTPLDVAASTRVCQTLQHGDTRIRSRSESCPSRASSRASLRSPWEPSAMLPIHRQESLPSKFDPVLGVDSGDSCEDISAENPEWLDEGRSLSGLRRRSTVETHTVDETEQGLASPSVTMTALRDQFAAQLQQLQHTMTLHFSNLPQFPMPNIPPVLPNYQAYIQSAPMMQRISSLVPNMRAQRPDSPEGHNSNVTDNKWGVLQLFGNKESPPAYEDIFPQKDLDIKQSSAAQAAAEFKADEKCASLFDQDQEVAEGSQSQEVPTVLQIGRKHLITKEQQETLQRAHAQRLKAGSSDKMLWFVWIPILVLVLGAMLYSGAPSMLSNTTSVAKTLGGIVRNPRDISNRIRNMIQELVY